MTQIEKGEIFASINRKDGMVSFHEKKERYDTNDTLSNLDKQIHETMKLTKKIKES